MTTIINGSSPSITFSDSTTQATGIPAPSTSGNVLTSTGTTWTSATPTANAYVGQRAQFFSASGTFTVPTGVTGLKVTLVGGGGGGGGGTNDGNGAGNGSTGGTTSFGTLVSQTGSSGGAGGNNVITPFTGTNGGTPGATLVITSVTNNAFDSFMNAAKTVIYGSGGANGTGAFADGNGGNANGYSISFITGQTPGASITVTVGAGGGGGGGQAGGTSGGTGKAGFVLVEW